MSVHSLFNSLRIVMSVAQSIIDLQPWMSLREEDTKLHMSVLPLWAG
jgi:hypothetical protein